jgi:hypothetical protein
VNAQSIGKTVLVLMILGGAGYVVWTNMRAVEEVDPLEVQRASQQQLIQTPVVNPAQGGLPDVDQAAMIAGFEKLAGPLDREALGKKCAELIEQVNPPTRLQSPPDLPDSRTVRKRGLGLTKRWNEEYLKTTKHGPAIKKEANELLTKLLRQNFGATSRDTRSQDIGRLKSLANHGTRDPVLYLFYKITTGFEFDRMLEMESPNHSSWFKALAWNHYHRFTRAYYSPEDKRVEVAQDYAQEFARLLSDCGTDAKKIDHFMRTDMRNHLGASRYFRCFVFSEWAKMELPPIDPYLMTYLAADAADAMAWIFRGNGYANEVEHWDVFTTELERAGQYFVKAWSLRPDLPYPARRMIAISRAGGHEVSDREWFYIATKMDFSSWSPYSSYKWSLLPRWGGSDQAMYDFVTELLETNEPEGLVQTHAREILRWYIDMEDSPEAWTRLEMVDLANLMADQLVDWKKSGLIKEGRREWTGTRDCALPIFIANRMFLEAAPLVREFDQPIRRFSDMPRPVDYEFCLSAIHAHGLRNHSKISSLEYRFTSLFEAFSKSELDVWENTLDALDESEAACRPYLRSRYEFGRVQTAIAEGKQTSLAMDAPIHCWACRNGTAKPSLDALRITRAGSSRPTLVSSRIAFEPPYSWQAQIERTGKPDDQLAITLRGRPADPASMGVEKSRDEFVFDLPSGTTLDVAVRVRDNKATVSVNGEEIQGYEPDALVPESFVPWIDTRGEISIKNVTIEGHR